MQRITHDRPWPLFDIAATRRIEQVAAAQLPPHSLMQRAGLAVAQLVLAVAPHARTVWLACGPGNNGGDGFEAAMHLKQWGKQPVVTWLGDEAAMPTDALASLRRARNVGVTFATQPPGEWDAAIDALLGIGNMRPLDGIMASWVTQLNARPARQVVSVDIPSGLNADTGNAFGIGNGNAPCVRASQTLSLLSLKPGLFTANGRDASGTVWLDDLGVTSIEEPGAWLGGPPASTARLHASHKGSYGDVAVIGGASGMTGAALLAASAALHGGAGRAFVALLDEGAMTVDASQPELMFRRWDSLALAAMHVVCGCGGGDAVRAVLHTVLSTARTLVLDADALNALAVDSQLQSLLQNRSRRENRATVLTPHPLEAARLLGSSAALVQADRLAAARELAARFACVVLLKGSGTVIAAPGRVPVINPTGNASLASAGTGDVLAGMVAARLAGGAPAFDAAAVAAFAHGRAADNWPTGMALTASALARSAALIA